MIQFLIHLLPTLLVLMPVWLVLTTLRHWWGGRPKRMTIEQKHSIFGALTILLTFFTGVLAALLW